MVKRSNPSERQKFRSRKDYKKGNPVSVYTRIADTSNKRVNLCLYMGSTWCTCVLPLQPYRDITSVLFCRLINVDILLLFLTISIRNKVEIKDTQHIVDAIYTSTFSSLVRSYRYKFHGHVIPSHIKRVVAKWL